MVSARKYALRIGGAIIAVLLLVAGPVAARERHALLIGTNSYGDNSGLRTLRSPGADTQLIAKRLATLGFSQNRLMNADLETIRNALNRLARRSGPGDVIIVYLSGHGAAITAGPDGKRRNVYLPANATALGRNALPLEEIETIFQTSAADVIVIVDACRNDLGFVEFDLTARQNEPGADETLGSDPTAAGSFNFFFSTQFGARAADLPPDSATSHFARALDTALKNPARDATAVFADVEKSVFDTSGQQQRPQLLSLAASYGVQIAGNRGPAEPRREDVIFSAIAPRISREIAGQTTFRAPALACKLAAMHPMSADWGAEQHGVFDSLLDPGRAIPVCRAAVAVAPTAQALFRLARAERANGQFEDALRTLKRIAEADQNALTEALRANLLIDLAGKQAPAPVPAEDLAQSVQMLERHPTGPALQLRLAQTRQEAISAAQRLARLAQRYPDAGWTLWRALQEHPLLAEWDGDADALLADLVAASHPMALVADAARLHQLDPDRHREQVIDHLQSAADQNVPEALFGLAMLSQEDRDKALQRAETQGSLPAALERLRLQFETGDPTAMERLGQLASEFESARDLLAQVHAGVFSGEAKDLDAMAHLVLAMQAAGDRNAARWHVWLLLEQDEMDAALDAMVNNALNGAHPWVLHRLAQELRDAGRGDAPASPAILEAQNRLQSIWNVGIDPQEPTARLEYLAFEIIADAAETAGQDTRLARAVWFTENGPLEDRQTALRLFRPLAEVGHPEAQAWVGHLTLTFADGRKDEIADGLEWLRRAAQNGQGWSAMRLGDISHYGYYGQRLDFTLAEIGYQRALELGRSSARTSYGQLLAGTWHAHRDTRKAEVELRQALEDGSTWAGMVLGELIWRGAPGISQDKAAGLAMMQASADQNDWSADRLARLLVWRNPEGADWDTALPYMEKAAKAGRTGSMVRFGREMLRGESGRPVDEAAGIAMLEDAVAKGSAWAAITLAHHHADRMRIAYEQIEDSGAEIDRDKPLPAFGDALRFYRTAAELDPEAYVDELLWFYLDAQRYSRIDPEFTFSEATSFAFDGNLPALEFMLEMWGADSPPWVLEDYQARVAEDIAQNRLQDRWFDYAQLLIQTARNGDAPVFTPDQTRAILRHIRQLAERNDPDGLDVLADLFEFAPDFEDNRDLKIRVLELRRRAMIAGAEGQLGRYLDVLQTLPDAPQLWQAVPELLSEDRDLSRDFLPNWSLPEDRIPAVARGPIVSAYARKALQGPDREIWSYGALPSVSKDPALRASLMSTHAYSGQEARRLLQAFLTPTAPSYDPVFGQKLMAHLDQTEHPELAREMLAMSARKTLPFAVSQAQVHRWKTLALHDELQFQRQVHNACNSFFITDGGWVRTAMPLFASKAITDPEMSAQMVVPLLGLADTIVDTELLKILRSSDPKTKPFRMAAQKELGACGYYSGKIDGIIGPGTRRAIEAARRRNASPQQPVIVVEMVEDVGSHLPEGWDAPLVFKD